MKAEIYVVSAYRFGNRNNHSYVLGVYKKKAQAIKRADAHNLYRGGKYVCEVECFEVDNHNEDFEAKIIYQTDKITH